MTDPGKEALLDILYFQLKDREYAIISNAPDFMQAFDGISNINKKSFVRLEEYGRYSYIDLDDIEDELTMRSVLDDDTLLSGPLSAGQIVADCLRRAAVIDQRYEREPTQDLANPETYISWIQYLVQRGAKVSIDIAGDVDKLQAIVDVSAMKVEKLERDIIAIEKKLSDAGEIVNTPALRTTASRAGSTSTYVAARSRADAEKLQKYRELGAKEIQTLRRRIRRIQFSVRFDQSYISKLHQLEKLFHENGIINTELPDSLKSMTIRALVENDSIDDIGSRFFPEHPIWEQVQTAEENRRYDQLYSEVQNKKRLEQMDW